MLDLLCVGHASFDITMATATHPGPDEKVFADAMQLAGGGPAANAAVCAARLGGKAGFCGYLGNDPFGDMQMREFGSEGVNTDFVIRGLYPSPVSQIIAKPNGARSLVNFKGNTPWLDADAISLNEMPKVMLFDGHEPLLSPRLCRRAAEHEIPTVLDAGSLHRGTLELAGMVDYLVASEKFARQWCESSDMEQALDELAAVSECVVITLGEHGLIWTRDGEYGKAPAFSVQEVDSTGAGDAFHGAFAYGLTLALDWRDLLSFASAAGALTCCKLGARPALPDMDEVQALLRMKESGNG
ncbi:sulfofructose kinase [Mariprofundus ferrinatatus]|uniref:Sulfofructose kinase n=1 Tax=Mariprofundus ferrinatatus TaxID=1921087 RepID=A0A2K8L1E8_9PROT|nr:PfkB family carbohydrate kinase [Mariprofundus ferrinatatus]ATX80902.1 sulfofructose kinase [Mariprofundus ferrinatatus]